jgi:hypothetical protein
MPAMRLTGRRGQAAAQRPMQIPPTITCPVCGLRNDITVRFCRNCGLPLGAPRDPVRGTTTKRADLPSDHGNGIAAIIGLLAVVGIVGVAGFLIFKGFQGSATTANASPGASAVVRASGAPVGTPGITFPLGTSDPAASRVPGTSQPAETDTPSATDDPAATDAPTTTDEPTDPGATATPRPIGTTSQWTCKAGAIADPLGGRWRITHANWSSATTTDRLTLSLTRVNGSVRDGTTVRMAFMAPSKAASTLGITRPLGDRALVLTFDGPTIAGTPMVGQPAAMRALASVDIRRDADGVTQAAIGISGTGCVRLSAPAWKTGSDATLTADLILDIRR